MSPLPRVTKIQTPIRPSLRRTFHITEIPQNSIEVYSSYRKLPAALEHIWPTRYGSRWQRINRAAVRVHAEFIPAGMIRVIITGDRARDEIVRDAVKTDAVVRMDLPERLCASSETRKGVC